MKRVFLAAAMASLIGTGSAQAATIFFDNFNTENGGTQALNYSGFANFTVSDGTVDLIGNGGAFDFLPGNGMYIDLDGSTNNAGVLTSNVMPLGMGLYTLSFDLAGSRRQSSPIDQVTINVFGDSLMYGSLSLNFLHYSAGFSNYSIPFWMGAADNVRFSFSNTGGDNQGALLDNVRLVSAAAPEPASMLLLGLAAGGLGIYRRRQV
jgi:hypothetical protein